MNNVSPTTAPHHTHPTELRRESALASSFVHFFRSRSGRALGGLVARSHAQSVVLVVVTLIGLGCARDNQAGVDAPELSAVGSTSVGSGSTTPGPAASDAEPSPSLPAEMDVMMSSAPSATAPSPPEPSPRSTPSSSGGAGGADGVDGPENLGSGGNQDPPIEEPGADAGVGPSDDAVAGAGGAGGSQPVEPDCDPSAVSAESLGMCQNGECVFGGGPGHYDVTVLIGGESLGSTQLQAESRRFMTGEVSTSVGETKCMSFTVNVREPEGQPIQDVSPGTPGLNLRIVGTNPSLSGVGVTPADPVVLYIAGDSTVCDQDPQLGVGPERRYTGWGQVLPMFFKHGISVTNYADSGEGTAAFRTDGGGLWNLIDAELKSGDWVMIQLGHNDKTTPAETYRSRILGMIEAIRARQAHPLLISPMVRNTGDPLAQQHIYGELDVRQVLMELAEQEEVPFIDLMLWSSEWAASVGQSTAQDYFVADDMTHSNELGAKLFAEFIQSQIREQDLPLAQFLRPE